MQKTELLWNGFVQNQKQVDNAKRKMTRFAARVCNRCSAFSELHVTILEEEKNGGLGCSHSCRIENKGAIVRILVFCELYPIYPPQL